MNTPPNGTLSIVLIVVGRGKQNTCGRLDGEMLCHWSEIEIAKEPATEPLLWISPSSLSLIPLITFCVASTYFDPVEQLKSFSRPTPKQNFHSIYPSTTPRVCGTTGHQRKSAYRTKMLGGVAAGSNGTVVISNVCMQCCKSITFSSVNMYPFICIGCACTVWPFA